MAQTTVKRPPSPALELRQDTLALGLLLVTTLAFLSLALWMARTYNSLPDLMPLHYDAQGNVDRVGERRELIVLPAIAGMVYLVNVVGGLLLRLRFRMSFASYLLWTGALMVQVMVWLAVWNITH